MSVKPDLVLRVVQVSLVVLAALIFVVPAAIHR